MKDGVVKLQLQLSKHTKVVADGVEFKHPKAECVTSQEVIEISPKQLDVALMHELRLTRTGDKVRMNVLVDGEGNTTYTLFNISEYSVPMRF
jgi:hypothetical protein